MSTVAATPRPAADRPRPAHRPLQRPVPRDRAAPPAAQPPHRDLHADHAAGVLPHLRHGGHVHDPVGRQRQRDRVHHGLDGAVRRDARHHERRRERLRRARAGLDPPAAADPAAPGRLRLHQGRRRDGHGPGRGRRGRGGRRWSAARSGDAGALVASLALAWVGSVVFAAFGLFMGYLLPAENVMQILGPVLALLAFAGGLFVPLGDGLFADIAKSSPTYGLAEIVRAPLTGETPSIWAVVNVVGWAAVFVGRRRLALPPRHARACDEHADRSVTVDPATVGAVRRRARPGDGTPRPDEWPSWGGRLAYASEADGIARRAPARSCGSSGRRWASSGRSSCCSRGRPPGTARTASSGPFALRDRRAGRELRAGWSLTRAGPHGSRLPDPGAASCSCGRSCSSRSRASRPTSRAWSGSSSSASRRSSCCGTRARCSSRCSSTAVDPGRPAARARLGHDRRPGHLRGPRVRRGLRLHAAGAAQPAAGAARRTRSPCSRSSGSASGSPATCTTSSATR